MEIRKRKNSDNNKKKKSKNKKEKNELKKVSWRSGGKKLDGEVGEKSKRQSETEKGR